MRLTPLRTPPARPPTHPGGSGRHGKKKKSKSKSKSKGKGKSRSKSRSSIPGYSGVRSLFRRKRDRPLRHVDLTEVSTKVDTYQEPPVPTVTGRLSGVGRRGLAGPLTPWMAPSSPMGEGALLAKHCFASARTLSRQRLGRTPEGGVRRVLPTHTAPPNQQ